MRQWNKLRLLLASICVFTIALNLPGEAFAAEANSGFDPINTRRNACRQKLPLVNFYAHMQFSCHQLSSNQDLTSRTTPFPPLTKEPYFASIAWATWEIIRRVSTLLYFVADLSLELPLPLASWLECAV